MLQFPKICSIFPATPTDIFTCISSCCAIYSASPTLSLTDVSWRALRATRRRLQHHNFFHRTGEADTIMTSRKKTCPGCRQGSWDLTSGRFKHHFSRYCTKSFLKEPALARSANRSHITYDSHSNPTVPHNPLVASNTLTSFAVSKNASSTFSPVFALKIIVYQGS